MAKVIVYLHWAAVKGNGNGNGKGSSKLQAVLLYKVVGVKCSRL